MKKFFIKHRNVIMAIVSVGLMLSFAVLGSKPTGNEDSLNSPAGFLDGQKVTVQQIENAKGELDLLTQFGLGGDSITNLERNWKQQGGDESKIGLFWYLLCQESQRYVVSPVSSADAVIQAAAASGRSDQDVINQLNSQSSSPEGLALSLTHLYGFGRYLELVSSLSPSLPAMELAGDRHLRTIKVEYVPIDAAQGWQGIPAADVAGDLQAQFDAYKGVVATHMPGPDDPPYFLGLGKDGGKEYAIIGYPSLPGTALHLHENDTIPWDGSKIDQFIHRGDLANFDASGNPNRFSTDGVVLSGGGRAGQQLVLAGLNIHGEPLPPQPAARKDVPGVKDPAGTHPDHYFPFGYKSPDMVKVEYLVFPRQNLRGRMNITEGVADAAVAAYKADPYKFRPRPVVPAATLPVPVISVQAPGAATASSQPATTSQPGTTSQPASTTSQPGTASAPVTGSTQPLVPTTQQMDDEWDNNPSVKQPYIEEQLDLRTTTVLKKLVDSARAAADRPWSGASPPDRSEWISYQTLAATVGADAAEEIGRISGFRRWIGDLGFGTYRPQIKTVAEFKSVDELVKIPGIGHAIFQSPQGQVFDFPTLATNVAELVTADKTTALGRLNLKVGEECPEVTDAQGNVYLFRVTEVQKAQEPASLAPVKAQVEEDCRKLHAYEAVMAKISPPDDPAHRAAADMRALAGDYKSTVKSAGPFSREGDEPAKIDSPPAEVQNIRGFLDAAFDLPAPTDNTPSVAIVPDEQSLMIYPLRVIEAAPAKGSDFYQERFGWRDSMDNTKPGFYTMAMDSPEAQKFVQDYFKIQAIAGRLKFTLAPGDSWPVK